MGNRLILILLGFTLAFGAGWLFANEVRPPRYEDLSMAIWIVAGAGSLLMAVAAAGGRR